VIFGHDILVYLSLALVAGVSWFLRRTRPGLILRAVGENDASAHAIGYPVIAIRYAAVAFGGAHGGLGGAYFSLALTPMWVDRMTAGRGWIALALVVFSAWKPGRLLLGAYLFGAVMTLELQLKAAGVTGSRQRCWRWPLPCDDCSSDHDVARTKDRPARRARLPRQTLLGVDAATHNGEFLGYDQHHHPPPADLRRGRRLHPADPRPRRLGAGAARRRLRLCRPDRRSRLYLDA
jgi:hypothetical protein